MYREWMLVNVIHPQMYKVRGNTLVGGPIAEFSLRDRNVNEFISMALHAGVEVLMHKNHPGNMMLSILEEQVLYFDDYFKVLFDSRVKRCTTTPLGIPLPDVRPNAFSEAGWNSAIEIYDTRSLMYEKVKAQSKAMFIGGVLENCVANAMGYFQEEFGFSGPEICYVPELCVSMNASLLMEMREKFRERGFRELSYEQALCELKL